MLIHYTGEVFTEIPVYLNDGVPGRPFAVLELGPARVHVHTTDDADKGIAAFVAARRLLDPGADPAGGTS